MEAAMVTVAVMARRVACMSTWSGFYGVCAEGAAQLEGALECWGLLDSARQEDPAQSL